GRNFDELFRPLVAAKRFAHAQIDPPTGRTGADEEKENEKCEFFHITAGLTTCATPELWPHSGPKPGARSLEPFLIQIILLNDRRSGRVELLLPLAPVAFPDSETAFRLATGQSLVS